MTTQIQTIQFNNQSLITFEQDGTHYTAMKPICENIGLAWHAQFERIKRDEVLSQGVLIIRTPTNGGEQQMICLPIQYLNGWLFGIDVKRVKPEIRETLIRYKKECYQVLHDYWNKGIAINERKTTVDERTGLRDAVNMLVSKKGLIYSEAYNLVHQRFNVESIEDLTPEQLPQAVEYVQRFAIEPYHYEGELVIDHPTENETVSQEDWLRFTSMWFALYNCVDLLGKLEQPLRAIGSHFGSTAYTHATEYKNSLIVMKRILEPMVAEFEVDPFAEPHYYKALKTLREYNVQGLGRLAKI